MRVSRQSVGVTPASSSTKSSWEAGRRRNGWRRPCRAFRCCGLAFDANPTSLRRESAAGQTESRGWLVSKPSGCTKVSSTTWSSTPLQRAPATAQEPSWLASDRSTLCKGSVNEGASNRGPAVVAVPGPASASGTGGAGTGRAAQVGPHRWGLCRWGRQGSNLRPRDYESPALTTELRPRPSSGGNLPRSPPIAGNERPRALRAGQRGRTRGPRRGLALLSPGSRSSKLRCAGFSRNSVRFIGPSSHPGIINHEAAAVL
jgi:hypothetical protein